MHFPRTSDGMLLRGLLATSALKQQTSSVLDIAITRVQRSDRLLACEAEVDELVDVFLFVFRLSRPSMRSYHMNIPQSCLIGFRTSMNRYESLIERISKQVSVVKTFSMIIFVFCFPKMLTFLECCLGDFICMFVAFSGRDNAAFAPMDEAKVYALHSL